MSEDISNDESSKTVDDTLQSLISKLYRHLSWYTGHTAYNLIKIKDEEDKKKEEEK